jgi:hypothetical protein
MSFPDRVVLAHCDRVSTNRFGAATQVFQQFFVGCASGVFFQLKLHVASL